MTPRRHAEQDIRFLEPRLDLLSEEYVLIQAWKKTVAHIRSHNWYSDTLELDRTAVNLPRFLSELSEELRSPNNWRSDPLRLVLAPKSQRWRLGSDAEGKWAPVHAEEIVDRLRPLAHVSIRDQVAATAVMLCLADRVETLQGDPKRGIETPDDRKQVVSYGNRLFCDSAGKVLRHRWGSGKLYRAYFSDYRTFVARPEKVADLVEDDVARAVIVQSDLRQFYDRVTPKVLAKKIRRLARPGDDPKFFAFAERLLSWRWDERDTAAVSTYSWNAGLSTFSRVALPQGLVASGFFANVTLLDFDRALQRSFEKEIAPGVRVLDACRYVDDLRIVLSVKRRGEVEDLEELAVDWLQGLLHQSAPGLSPERAKTHATDPRGDERPLLRQGRKMDRIQTAISGGFDAIKGEEILDAVNALIRSQLRYSEGRPQKQAWLFSPVPDVRDETVARFAATRFRSTYRSIRPLLQSSSIPDRDAEDDDEAEIDTRRFRTQSDLDDDARSFALGLIEDWVQDPSNVRLLRIGLDVWPSVEVLNGVLDLLRPYADQTDEGDSAERAVALYCLAEIFRAGATETGFVEDLESLPDGIDIGRYRRALRDECFRLASTRSTTLPWYVMQQMLLYLAVAQTERPLGLKPTSSKETRHYYRLLQFLEDDENRWLLKDASIYAVLVRRSLRDKETSLRLVADIGPRRLERIARMDPSFALEIHEAYSGGERLSATLRADLCLRLPTPPVSYHSLAELVLDRERNGPLRNEERLLEFAVHLLDALSAVDQSVALPPGNVFLKQPETPTEGPPILIVRQPADSQGSIYAPPKWCAPADAWRFQLGYLLRFILTAREDFTTGSRQKGWKQTTVIYKPPENHWHLRFYSLFNAHPAFGDDWLPISEWTEHLLAALLAWPGYRGNAMITLVSRGISALRAAVAERWQRTRALRGPASGVQMLPIRARAPARLSEPRPLRACVVQTVIPSMRDFTLSDLSLSDSTIRKLHRNHLSAALMAIERMLDLRETHLGRDGRLDLLIFPELSVHPHDVVTHLVPFARQRKTIILAGVTYERLSVGPLLINSGIWVIPEMSAAHGLQVRIRRQGKQHLARNEQAFNMRGPAVEGFRPCQWLVGYDWSSKRGDRPLWLTASICYDATDLCLAADLRHLSDVFVVPALNADVGTFDQMALALNYHMFQLVLVANNGTYGGSNAHAPYQGGAFKRQVFHLHGQPQASIAFLEIDNVGAFLNRRSGSDNTFKSPPAGLGLGMTALEGS